MGMISRAEFDTIVGQLTESPAARYDMLFAVADRILQPKVRYLCFNNRALRGKQLEEDIMQEIKTRLFLTCHTLFLFRDGELNDDPDGFKNWMYAVARNIVLDHAKKEGRHMDREKELDAPDMERVPDPKGSPSDLTERKDEAMKSLRRSFQIVLDSGSRAYIVLTWIAFCVFSIVHDAPKLQTEDMLLEAFESRTLREMYETVLRASDRFPWMAMSEAQRHRVEAELKLPYRDGRPYGELRYQEVFMKKGGKYSISEWIGRMNKLIENETGGRT